MAHQKARRLFEFSLFDSELLRCLRDPRRRQDDAEFGEEILEPSGQGTTRLSEMAESQRIAVIIQCQ